MKIKFQPKDFIAIGVLIGCFYLLAKGIDSFISALTASIVAYYFSKRVYEEKNRK